MVDRARIAMEEAAAENEQFAHEKYIYLPGEAKIKKLSMNTFIDC